MYCVRIFSLITHDGVSIPIVASQIICKLAPANANLFASPRLYGQMFPLYTASPSTPIAHLRSRVTRGSAAVRLGNPVISVTAAATCIGVI